jgi:uncharacterized protein YeaO (DUF488 family)
MIKAKRAFESVSKSDGYRILVDRLWPRGIKKSDLALDEWAKELAPSNELRKSFGHDPARWKEFRSKYLAELRTRGAKEKLHQLTALARRGCVTLVYAARDEEHNNAVVLRALLERRLKPRKTAARRA